MNTIKYISEFHFQRSSFKGEDKNSHLIKISLTNEIGNEYKIPENIDSELINYLIQETKENNEIELKEFEDIFQCILENKVPDFYFSDIKRVEYIFRGLSYFGVSSDYMKRFYILLMDQKTAFEKSEINKQIEAFFERHLDKVDWNNLSQNTNLSEAFFERHLDKVHWYWLSYNTNLSEAFFERYLDKVDWKNISLNTNLSEAFFERHLNKVNWICL